MFKVKAIYEYASPHDDDLQFPIGQIITVTEEEDEDWYSGEYTDDAGVHHEGIFPRNFVEKYEPVAPPRPTRTRHKHSEASVASLVSPTSPSAAAPEAPASPPPPSVSSLPPVSPPPAAVAAEEEPEPERIERVASPVYTSPPPAPASPPKPAAPAAPAPPPVPSSPVVAPVKPADLPISTSPVHKPAPAGPKQGGPPPPVSEKPSSFRDRIAAFNRAAAPPITPFKPSGLGGGSSSNFIKKPFVAPPPSRNAYIPQPREAPTAKIYRRDEDPEVREQEAENLESAEKAGLIPGAAAASGTNNNEDDEPKPMMSLKERLARLQREQQEQAQRHAEAAYKKEKPKRPPKKRLDSHDATAAAAAAADEAAGSAPDTSDAGGRHSIDDSHPPRTTHAPRRRASKDPEAQDGNDADMSGAGDTTEGQDEDLTERDDSDEKSRRPARPIIPIVLPGAAPGTTGQSDEVVEDEEAAGKGEETAKGEDEGGEAQEEVGEEEEEEEEIDPEVRRREELRARMAKMSGGMGMMGMQGMQGMFGAPPPPIKKKKASTTAEKRLSEVPDDTPSAAHAPPVPTMMALPGLATRRSEEKPAAPAEPVGPTSPTTAEEQEEEQTPRSPIAQPPPLPSARPVPPPPPAAPPAVKQTSEGSESDDELSEQTTKNAPETSHPEPPPPPPAAVPTSPTSPAQSNKRMSRIPPPIPGSAPALPPVQTRPPPPPPPGGGISRQSTMEMRTPISLSQSFQQSSEVPASSDGEDEEEVTEYEGDYDTDIANPVPHKNSLKSHARDSSLEDSVSLKSPVSEKPSTFPPPVPGASRAPPPIPNQLPPPPTSQSPHAPPSATADRRRSVDVPRGPPPPPPPPPPPVEETEEQSGYEDKDYDPYNYVAPPTPSAAVPTPGYAPPPPQPPPPPSQSFMGGETYTPPDLTLAFAPGSASSSTTTRTHPPGPPPPPPPPSAPGGQAATAMHSSRATRQSMDMSRASGSGRRSVDVSRPSMESGFVANEIDLAPQSGWWLQPNSLPPQLQGRRDIFFESEESQTAKRGGKVAITRDIYVLYLDYSQTVITVRFDPTDASDVQLEQRHEGPPLRLRQDQLEQSYERFGRHIADSVVAKKDTVVGDGTPQGLVLELVRPFRDALLPVGTRAYGALVYSNLANASTTQNDEIRAGDIITLRNARFQGKHGPMHAKYSMEVGKPDHVGVVSEWDGTKKKVRAWEQGRESKKVKLESFKLDDLRSGEVKIWRVMPRSWVGWEGQN